ncbi:MAG: type I-E CRISPR-associated protein Cas6/Cse3/CasE [Hyphomicrobiales bacterium]
MYVSQLLLRPDAPDTWRWLGDCHRLHTVIMSGFRELDGVDDPRAQLGVLFRVEARRPDSLIPVLVQSKELPDWSGVESRAIVRPLLPSKPLDRLKAGIAKGSRYRFRLRANPTRRIHRRAFEGPDERELTVDGEWLPSAEIPAGRGTGIRRRIRPEEDARMLGKRVDLRREEERIAWLQRRGKDHDGFDLARARVVPGIAITPRDGADSVTTRADPGGRLGGRKVHERTQDGLRVVDRRLTFGSALFEGELIVSDPEAFRAALAEGIGPGKAFGCGLLSLAPIPTM